MAPKKKAVAALHFEAKVCVPKFVKKANMYVVTEHLVSGKQTQHWTGTEVEAQKKYETVKAAIAAA